MKRFLALALLCLTAAGTAHAAGNRITVNEVHAFVAQANDALNNPNIMAGRNFLQHNVAENAMFENSVESYAPGHPMYADVWYRQTYQGYAYRYPYPYYPYHKTTSFQQMRKWDKISAFENKKRLIVGYAPEFTITGVKMRPDASAAVVDVDLKEYSTRYAPNSLNLTSSVMHANSKCKMYLAKARMQVFMTRLDCNTVTSMPF